MIYISTRNRLDVVRKNLPRWVDAVAGTGGAGDDGVGIRLVVEPQEADKHFKLLKDDLKFCLDDYLNVLVLPENDRGVGYSRMHAYMDAVEHGNKVFVSADDDLYPRAGSDVARFMRRAQTRGRWACGGWVDSYQWLTGGKMVGGRGDGAVPTRSGIGFRCYALNTACMTELGVGDDKNGLWKYRCFEDNEIWRRGVWLYERPWYIDTDFRLVSTGKRHEPGGMGDYHYGEVAHESHKLTWQEWGGYVPDPAKCPIDGGNGGNGGDGGDGCKHHMKWKKFMQDNNAYIPWDDE